MTRKLGGRPKKPLTADEIQDLVRRSRDENWDKLPELIKTLVDQGIEGDRHAAVAAAEFLMKDPRLDDVGQGIKDYIDDFRAAQTALLLEAPVPDEWNPPVDEGEGEGGEELSPGAGDVGALGSHGLPTVSQPESGSPPPRTGEADNRGSAVGQEPYDS